MKKMNYNLNKFLFFSVFLIGCSTNIQQSQEEIEYQKFASRTRSELNKSLTLSEENAMAYQKAYAESGLQELIEKRQREGTKLGSQADLDEFYEKSIQSKYENQPVLEDLRIDFVRHATAALSETPAKGSDDSQRFIKYSRELMKNNRSIDASLSYRCLSAIKGSIETDEFNSMVKKAKFQVRFSIEEFEKTLAAAEKADQKVPLDQLKHAIEKYQKYQSDLDALINK